MQTLMIGQTLRDKITGFTGIATMRTELLSGNVQYGLQPKAKADSDTIPEPVYFDWHLLEVVDDGVVHLLPPADTTNTHPLGSVVQDTVTGVTGTVTEIITFQNGCVYLAVQPRKKDTDEKIPQILVSDHKRFIATGAPAVTVQPSKTGGPNRRAPRLR